MVAEFKIRPSNIGLAFRCPGVTDLAREVPDALVPEAGKFAAAGTAAHALAERWLLDGECPWDERHGSFDHLPEGEVEFLFYDDERGQFKLDDAAPLVERYVTYVLEQLDNMERQYGEATLYVEESVTIRQLGGYPGTIDAVIVAGDRALALDFKAGRGVSTDAMDQGACYVLGIFDRWQNVQTVVWQVVQPGASVGGDGGYRRPTSWTRERSGILGRRLEERLAQVAKDDNLVVGEHCQSKFCPYRFMCPELRNTIMAKLSDYKRDNKMLTAPEAVEHGIRFTPLMNAYMADCQKAAATMHSDPALDMPANIIATESTSDRSYWVDPDTAKALIAELGMEELVRTEERLPTPKRTKTELRKRKGVPLERTKELEERVDENTKPPKVTRAFEYQADSLSDVELDLGI